MLDITAIEDHLYGWISKIDSNCIIANPNAPRPSGVLYSTIHVMESIPQGVAESSMTLLGDFSADVEYSDVEELMVSINAFRSGAYQLATQIKDSFRKVTAYDYFNETSLLGFLRASAVRDLTIEVDKSMEERAQFDCFFATRSLESENIATIRKIEVTDELDGSTFQVDHPVT